MSIRFPETNMAATGDRVHLQMPSTLIGKGANVGYTTVCWFRTPNHAGDIGIQNLTLLAKASGTTGGHDGSITVDYQFLTLTCTIRSSSSVIYADSVSIGKGKTYMAMLIANAANTHLVVYEVGVGITRATKAENALYALNMNTNYTWQRIGGSGAANSSWIVQENVAMWTGLFPETAGVPDEALIADIANGVVELADVSSVPGISLVNKFHFPLANDLDLTDAFGGVEVLTPFNISVDAGRVLYPCGPLRPGPITPTATQTCISQAVFATRGDISSGTASIIIEGGSYTGLAAMSKMQVRLVNEIGRTVVSDWSDLTTTAPSGGAGTWTGKTITGVPAQAGYLYVEFRALDVSSNVIAGPVSSYGLRGAGFHMVGQAQSQLHQLVDVGGNLAVTSGIRAITTQQFGNEENLPDAALPYVTQNWMVSSGTDRSHGMRHGIRALFNEVNQVCPGMPVQFSTVSLGGTSLSNYSDHGNPGTPNWLALRWEYLKANFGIVQPYYQLFLGHSSGTGGTADMLASVVAWSKLKFGTPIKYLHVPVPRYRSAGVDETFGNAGDVAGSRNGARQYCTDNPAENIWLGSWSTVFCTLSGSTENVGSDPHSDLQSPYGQGRTGALLGMGLLMASGAVVDVPIGLTDAQVVSPTRVKLVFGSVNPALD